MARGRSMQQRVYPSDDSLQTTARDADVLVLDSGASIIRQGANRRPGDHGQDDEAHPTFQDVCTMVQKSGVNTKELFTMQAPSPNY